MAEHWNIQINIQRVITNDLPPASASRRISTDEAISGVKKDVTEILKLAITADSQAEAYAKTDRMLRASFAEPDREPEAAVPLKEPLPRMTSRPIRDNPQA